MKNQPVNIIPQRGDVEEIRLKFILVGDAAVGKSSILSRYTKDEFTPNYGPTIGLEFGSKFIEISEELRLRFQIWDTAGHGMFTSVTKGFYSGASCIFLVYDKTNRTSFEHLGLWTINIRQNCEPGALVILVGNKSDVPSNKNTVTKEEGLKFMKENGLDLFFETSAATCENVNSIFNEAARNLHTKYTEDRVKEARAMLAKKFGDVGTQLGGRGTERRKKKVTHKTAVNDEKKFKSVIKKYNFYPIQQINEVNMFTDDGYVIQFKEPEVMVSFPSNAFIISGKSEEKKVTEFLPDIISHFGPKQLGLLKEIAAKFNAK